MPVILAASSDISTVPADFVKFFMIMLGWLVTVGGALWAGKAWGKKGSSEDPLHVQQPLQVQQAVKHADKSELDALKSSVDAMRQEIAAQFLAAQRAGEARVSAITESVDADLGVLGGRIGNLAEALHEKINRALVDNAAQAEAITNIKASIFRHDAEVRAIQQAIADLIKHPTKRGT